MRTRRPSTVALLTALVLAAGCAPDPERTAPTAPAAEPAPSPGRAPEQRSEEAAPAPPERPPSAPDPGVPSDCDTATREHIEATLSTQLDAFAVEDLPAAYAMTSPFFRTFVDEDAFDALIRGDYPQLLGNDGHRFDECRTVGRRAFIVVGVRADDTEVVLRYDLSEEPDGWRIDGARTLDGIVLPPAPLV